MYGLIRDDNIKHTTTYSFVHSLFFSHDILYYISNFMKTKKNIIKEKVIFVIFYSRRFIFIYYLSVFLIYHYNNNNNNNKNINKN